MISIFSRKLSPILVASADKEAEPLGSTVNMSSVPSDGESFFTLLFWGWGRVVKQWAKSFDL